MTTCILKKLCTLIIAFLSFTKDKVVRCVAGVFFVWSSRLRKLFSPFSPHVGDKGFENNAAWLLKEDGSKSVVRSKSKMVIQDVISRICV